MKLWRAIQPAETATLRVDKMPERDLTGSELPADMLGGIQGNASLVKQELSATRGSPVDFSADSVAWVEGYIERIRTNHPQQAKGLVSTLGSYLGEAIIAEAGGEWRKDQDGLVGIRFSEHAWCFPFSKVQKQIDNGVEDGIASFYKLTTGLVATGQLAGSPRPGA